MSPARIRTPWSLRQVAVAALAAVFALAPLAGLPEAAAQSAPPPPPKLEPLPEPPPPPPGAVEQDLEPQVTIIQRDSETVEEYRVGGRLVMIKVTPRGSGIPYFLVDEAGNGRFIRRESFETGLRVPLWLLFTF